MLKQSCAEYHAQSAEGAVPGGSQKSTFALSTLLVRANFSFLFAYDRTGHQETILTKTLPKEMLM